MKDEEAEGNNRQFEVATLGGGCFWCTEAIFSEIKGVIEVEPGYSGGTFPNPTYEQISTGITGHAEVVQITFDRCAVSFREILEVFFATHDPTTLNKQGADVGTQYRSVIFYHSVEQKTIAHKLITELNNSNIYHNLIITQVEPFTTFFRAEDYHRNYFKRNRQKPYCKFVISPKLDKLHKKK